MRWVVPLILLASCYSPAPYANCGVTCATSTDCPTGQACFANRCSAQAGQCAVDASSDAELDGSSTSDADGDGLVDAVDKCPAVPSPDNRDHDGDGLGDICDPCPMFTNNTNSDTDKIGDLCDPRPANGADVATFYGFYDAAEYTTWGRGGNSWTILNGRVVGSNANQGGAYFETPGSFGGNVAVYAEVEIMGVAVTTSERMVGISARRTSSGFYEGCQAAVNQTAGKHIRVRKYNGSETISSASYSGTFDGPHPLRLIAFNAVDDCMVDTFTVQGAGVVTTGKVAIDSSLVDITVDYLFVVTMN